MKRLVLYLVLLGILSSCDWFKKKDDNSDETYTISGTMYDANGTTPLAGKTLRFDASSKANVQNSFIKLGTTITDSDGKFSISYSHFAQSQSEGISINQPHEELPVHGPFLRNIPINQNILRDICLAPKEYCKCRIVSKGSRNDTLYMASARTPIEWTKISINHGYNGVLVPLNQSSIFESEIITRFSTGSMNGSDLNIYYTTDKQKFLTAFDSKSIPDNFHDLVNTAEFSLETFPVVNTLEIVIE